MASPWSYGDPSRQVARPPCWGTNKYDNEDRECKGCGFQNTCKDQVLKDRQTTPWQSRPYWAPQPTYQQPSSTSTALASRVPAYLQPQVAQQPVQVQQVRPQQATITVPVLNSQTVQQQPAVGSIFLERYGQVNDPMFAAIKSIPPVPRAQQQGETFAERMFKNVMLATGEAVLGELFLGLRQFLWAPPNK